MQQNIVNSSPLNPNTHTDYMEQGPIKGDSHTSKMWQGMMFINYLFIYSYLKGVFSAFQRGELSPLSYRDSIRNQQLSISDNLA